MSRREIEIWDQLYSSRENENKIRYRNEKYQNISDLNNLNLSTSASESNSNSTAPRKENWGWSNQSQMIKSLHYFLTKETFSKAVKIFQFSAFLKCVPFELESKNGENLRVQPFQKKWQWDLWHVVSWIIFGMMAFEYISFCFLWQRTSFGKEIVFHIMYLNYITWTFVFFLSVYRKPHQLILSLNHHDEIMRHSSKLGLNRKHWASHPFVTLAVYYTSWAFCFNALALTFFYLKHPERSQYIYSAFPSSLKEDGWILYEICALFEFFWIGCGSLIICLLFCYWCAHCYMINGILNQLRKSRNLNEVAAESYIFLQLLCISLNDLNSNFFIPGFCFIVVATPVLYIYLSLTTYHLLSIFIYLAFPVFAVLTVALILLFLPQPSKVQIKSRDALEHFTHLSIGARPQNHSSNLINLSHLTDRERRGYLKRRVKAFRRLRVQISCVGAFSLQTSGDMMEHIINNVLLLLSL